MSSSSLERELRMLEAPDEDAAQRRAWETVRTAYHQREPAPHRRSRWRFAPVPVAVAIATALALSPAGAAVHRWIDHTLGVRHAHPGVFSLPAPGRLLVSGHAGTWTVSADGVKRRLGPWPEATWSAHGKYVLVAGRDQLVATDTRGTPRWSISRPAVRFPRWFAPDGYRVAYLSGSTLRVIAGDGTNDRLLAVDVPRIGPAWRSGHAYELAYASSRHVVVARDVDSGIVAWTRHISARIDSLAWSGDGSRLLVMTRTGVLVLDGSGRPIAELGAGERATDAALAPDGRSVAILSRGQVTLTALPPRARVVRRVFGGDGLRELAWSPDGRWLLVTSPAADQWVFIHAVGRPRISADSQIAQQFAGSGAAFPNLDGWCCTTGGGASG